MAALCKFRLGVWQNTPESSVVSSEANKPGRMCSSFMATGRFAQPHGWACYQAGDSGQRAKISANHHSDGFRRVVF